jgi:hypothetical protein
VVRIRPSVSDHAPAARCAGPAPVDGALFASIGDVTFFEAAGLFAVLLVFAAWAAWLGRRTGAARTWGLCASFTVLAGAITTVLAAIHVVAEQVVPMSTIARAVAFGWALAVSLATLHAYHRRPWTLFGPTDDEL